MPITGYKELSKQLTRMGSVLGGKTLRSAAMTATLPALKAAKAAAPQGGGVYGPYQGTSKETGRSWTSGQGDPYPKKTYKGRLVTPGFGSRSIARKSRISKDKRTVTVMIGVRPEAFYMTQFIELGTSRIPARPWLEPAFRRSISAVDTRFKDQLKRKIDKAIKR